MKFYQKVLEAKRENRMYAIATVVKTEGRTPRSAGTKMIVYGNGEIFGTVGGGIVEQNTIRDALTAMKTGETMLHTYSAVSMETVDRGMVCGNNMTVFIEPGERLPYLYLCGCGHVAQAVLPLAKSLGFYVVGIDARDVSGFGDALKGLDELIVLGDFKEIDSVDFVPGSTFIVGSYSHATDGDILRVILGKEPGYVGMLGGKPKIRALFKKLLEAGYSEETLREIHAPIGLDIGGEQPAHIAVSIMAEILAAQNGREPRSMRDILQPEIFPL